jgi:perosamine synthetase
MTKFSSKDSFIPVFSPDIDKNDIASVVGALKSGNISGTSPIISEFESHISEMAGTKYAVALANGSVALDLALVLSNVGVGDEVILPSFTIISCLSAVLRTGATAVLIDCERDSWNLDASQVRDAITSRTRAILAVHVYGLPADIVGLRQDCFDKEILLIEDSAEAHGLVLAGQRCGSIGDISTFSFYANKHITTGEGGAICTSNEGVAKKARQLRNLAFLDKQRFYHENFGWNYRMGSLQAALGISQSKKLTATIAHKQIQGRQYDSLIKSRNIDVQTPLESYLGTSNNYWVYGVVFPSENAKDTAVERLRLAGIESRPFFWPLHLQPVIQNQNFRFESNFANSDHIGRNGIYLPMGSHISHTTQERIIGLL